MADSIVRLTINSQEYDQKLKRAQEGLTRYADECRKVGGTLEVVEKDTLEYVRALGQMETVSRTATGKLAELKKTFTELSVVYKNMSEQEKQSPFGKALSSSLDQLKVRINDSKAQLDDISKSLNGGGGLSGALDSIAGKFGVNISQLTKFGSVVGVTTTALQVAKDAFFQSESGIDEWGRTVEGAKGAYNIFLDTLNNGNWSNFFENLQTAIKGGRDLYDVFDRLGSIKSNNAAAIAIVQQQIAQLRLAKQQGENVDAQLKEATERLAQLQKQSITAGKVAGNKSAFEVIRNGVNSVGGAGVNDATIKYAVQQIMKNGQSEFDKYKYNYQTLQQKGMVTRTQTINDSQGGTYERQYKEFDINALTKEQQKQYSLAKAITEGETRIQKGIAAYATAVQEGTASAREEFKGNRYALQGAGGGKGGSGSSTTKVEQSEMQTLQKQIQELEQEYIKLGGITTEDANKRRGEINAEIAANETRINQIKLLQEQSHGRLLGGGNIQTTGIGGSLVQFPTVGEGLGKETMDYINSLNKGGKDVTNSWKVAASAISQVGGALSGLKNPAIDIMTVIAQSIATVALAYSQTLAKDASSKTNIWSFIAAAAAATVSMASTIASIHSSTGYAEGGIVKGNSYSGDNVPAMVGDAGGQLVGLNAGELVLTKAQQANLAGQLQGNGSGLSLKTKVKGTELLVWLDNSLAKSGRGELVTWAQ